METVDLRPREKQREKNREEKTLRGLVLVVTAVIPVKTCEFIQHCDIGPVINILTLGLRPRRCWVELHYGIVCSVSCATSWTS